MKIVFHTGDESPDELFTAEHDAKAGGWVPLVGDRVVWEYTEWIVTDRSWHLDYQPSVLHIWMAKV